jgi:hypothetical protein
MHGIFCILCVMLGVQSILLYITHLAMYQPSPVHNPAEKPSPSGEGVRRADEGSEAQTFPSGEGGRAQALTKEAFPSDVSTFGVGRASSTTAKRRSPFP